MINHPIRHYPTYFAYLFAVTVSVCHFGIPTVSQLIEFACTVATNTIERDGETGREREGETDRKCQASGNVKTKVKRHRHLKRLSVGNMTRGVPRGGGIATVGPLKRQQQADQLQVGQRNLWTT